MPPTFRRLDEAARWFDAWLREAALPLWAGAGVDAEGGGFQEALTVEGAPWAAPRRARVQARQVWVFAAAAAHGLGAGYGELAERAYGAYRTRYRLEDGRFARCADEGGRVVDATPALYEQAFTLLAQAGLHREGAGTCAADAERLRQALEASARHPAGGFREEGGQPYQANAHMHLLEAALAWHAAGGAKAWAALADDVAELALARFIDPRDGVLREFFDAEWRPLDEAEGGLIEPGHQFEWAWLLDRWGALRGREDALAAARRLYQAGRRGVDRARKVVVNALAENLTVRDAGTRLWAQTEYLKAALIFGDEAEATAAAEGLALYLDTPARGAWRDKMRPDGGFVDEPAPATSFYHLMGAILPLRAAAGI